MSGYLADWSDCMTPNSFPSVSLHVANHPTPGIGPFGRTIEPPAAVTLTSASSIDDTPIVFEFVAPSDRRDVPPSMPRSASGPVVMTQYSKGPCHLSNF